MIKNEKKLLESINNKMKWLLRFKAEEFLEDKSSREQVKTLHDMGFEVKEMAEILDKTENNIRTQISQLKSSGQIE